MNNCGKCKHYIDDHCSNIDFCSNYSGFENIKLNADKIVPDHYHKGNVDTIKFCIENNLDFLQGNVVKYVVRYKEKNGLEDLKKAMEYLKRIIESEKNK